MASPNPAGLAAVRRGQTPATKPRGKRLKYTPRACMECHRRKVRCNGMEPCYNCVSATTKCVYPSEPPRPRGRARKEDPKKQVTNPAISCEIQPTTPSNADTLLERLMRIERDVQDLRAVKHTAEVSPASLSDELSASTEPELVEEESIDCIHSGHRYYNSFAVQIETLKNAASRATSAAPGKEALLGTASNTSPSTSTQSCRPQTTRNNIKTFISSSTRLKYLLNLFFEEYNFLYPCIDQDTFNIQLQCLLQHYSPDQDCLYLSDEDPEMLIFAALTCRVLAIAEHIEADGHSPTDGSPHERIVRGQAWYRESARLLSLSSRHADKIIDTVRLFMLETLYMLMRENFRRSSQALCRAVELSFSLGLNDESTWTSCSCAETRSRRVLWWTIYFFDRRMAYKLGRPYLIRDAEVSVGDFTADIWEMERARIHLPNLLVGDLNASEPIVSTPIDCDWIHYLQFNVGWGRLFSKAWDSLYSLTSPRAGSIEEIEIMEALLAKLKRSLPPGMKWQDPVSSSSPEADVPDRKVRMRLVIYTRANLLQMLIRNNLHLRGCERDREWDSSRSDRSYTTQVCHKLAASTVQAIVSYVRTRRRERSFGTYATLCIIESLYYMLSLPSTEDGIGAFDLEATKTMSLEQAWECLNDLSRRQLTIATNALKVLKGTIESRIGSQLSIGEKPSTASLSKQDHQSPVDQAMIYHAASQQEDHAETPGCQDLDFSLDPQFALPVLAGPEFDGESLMGNDMGIWSTEHMMYT